MCQNHAERAFHVPIHLPESCSAAMSKQRLSSRPLYPVKIEKAFIRRPDPTANTTNVLISPTWRASSKVVDAGIPSRSYPEDDRMEAERRRVRRA